VAVSPNGTQLYGVAGDDTLSVISLAQAITSI
jgi:hypothetical protein